MKLPLRLSIELALLAALATQAQTADEFFDSGAQLYISNNIPAALQAVESGRKQYADDVKLKKLEELLKRRQQQQQQQNQNQNSNQQQNNQNSSKNQKQQSHQENQQSQSQADRQKQQQNRNSQPGQKPEESAGKTGQKMSPEDARRLLDAQKGDEQMLQFKPPTPPENGQKPLKDW